jgi:hypothetical protein
MKHRNLLVPSLFALLVVASANSTRGELLLSIGSTNQIAGQPFTVPITLSTAAEISKLSFLLQTDDPHIVSVDLSATAPEVLSASMERINDGPRRITLELDPALGSAGSRELAQLVFVSSEKGKSSIARLNAIALEAQRPGGELAAGGAARSGRIFVIEDQPLLDLEAAGRDQVRMVLYGRPGWRLILQTSAVTGEGASWTDATELTMPANYHSSHWPIEILQPIFFRLLKLE